MKKISLVIWDWNGTLFNDVSVCIDTINELLCRHDYPPLSGKADYHSKFCFPIIQYYQNLGMDFARTPFDAMAQEFMEIYHAKSTECCLQSGAEETLAALNACGVEQILLSASMQQHLEQQVSRFSIRPWFDQLLGIRDIYAKSKVYLAEQFLAQRGLDPETVLFIGDSVHDHEVAAACGCGCVLFSGGHQPREKLAATGRPVLDALPELIEYCCLPGAK